MCRKGSIMDISNLDEVMQQEAADALSRQSRKKEPSWKEEELNALDESSRKMIDQVLLTDRSMKHRLEKFLNGLSDKENLYDMHITRLNYDAKADKMDLNISDADGHDLGKITGTKKGIFPDLDLTAVKTAQQELEQTIQEMFGPKDHYAKAVMQKQAKQAVQKAFGPEDRSAEAEGQQQMEAEEKAAQEMEQTAKEAKQMPNKAVSKQAPQKEQMPNKSVKTKEAPSWAQEAASATPSEPAISEESRSALEQTITDEKVRNNVENFMSDIAMDNKTDNLRAVDIQYNEKTKEARVAIEGKDGEELGTITGNDKEIKLMDHDALAKETEQAQEFAVSEQAIAESTLNSYKETISKELNAALESIHALEGAAAMPQMADAFNAIRENLQFISTQGINEMQQAMGAKVEAAKDAIEKNLPDDLVQADKEVQKGFEEMAQSKRSTVRDVGDKFRGAMDKVKEVAVKAPAKMASVAEKGALEAVNYSKQRLLKQLEKDTIQRSDVVTKLAKQHDALSKRQTQVRQKWAQFKSFVTGKEYSQANGPKLFEAITRARMSKIDRQMHEQQLTIDENARTATALKDRIERSVETVRTFNKDHNIVEAPSVKDLLQSATDRAKAINVMNEKATQTVNRTDVEAR